MSFYTLSASLEAIAGYEPQAMESGGRTRLLAIVCLLSLAERTLSLSNSTSSQEEKILLDTDHYQTLSLLGPEGESQHWLSLFVENGVELQDTDLEKVR